MSYFPRILQVKLFVQFARMVAPGDRGRVRAHAVLAVLLVLGGGGCASSDVAPAPRESPVPPSANVNVDQAWQDAKTVAGRQPGREPAMGAGASMQPVYGDNTMLVISPIEYGELREGMSVAYLNRRGVRVVHRLVEKVAGGWRVIGLNNEREDEDLVTRMNLIGVVYASFNYDDEPPKR
jgi:hypothetical protein